MIIFNLPPLLQDDYAEIIAEYVLANGGEFAVTKKGIDYYIKPEYKCFMLLMFPVLDEVPMIY